VLTVEPSISVVNKDNAALFGQLNGLLLDFLFVDQFAGFFLDQLWPRRRNLEFLALLFGPGQVFKQALQLRGHFFHAWRSHDFHAHGKRHIQFDFLLVQFSGAQFLAEFFPRATGGFVFAGHLTGENRLGSRQQRVQYPFLGGFFGLRPHFGRGFFAGQLDGAVNQVANDGFHVFANVTDFGKFGGFHLDEGGIGQARQSPGDFGFAHAGGADHEDVLGCDFAPQFFGQLHPAPAVAKRNGHGALGVGLANNVTIQFVNNFTRGHVGHGLSCGVGWEPAPISRCAVLQWSGFCWCRYKYPPQYSVPL